MIFKQLENFLPRIDILLPEIKKIKLYSDKDFNKTFGFGGNWAGLRSEPLQVNNIFLYEYLNHLLFQKELIDPGNYKISSCVHLLLEEHEDTHWIHKDPHKYAGLIYLSDTDYGCGTNIYDDDKKIINTIIGIKNRAIMYSGNYYHNAYGKFGNVEGGRLTLNFFINSHEA
tara:strand:- start:157 stop:669 length:513 start_codon:yes stop_codon:yes gene_type:complete